MTVQLTNSPSPNSDPTPPPSSSTPNNASASSLCSSNISITLRKNATHSALPLRPDRPPPIV
eukprot:CCRYP_004413-RA/>CCRYP_004413-RA protein AED:0.00 eAED:0.00 QI:35/1/1/1/0/0/2/707/61